MAEPSDAAPRVDEPAAPAAPERSNGNRKSLGRRLRLPLMLAGVAAAAVAALLWWLSGGRYQATDDAYLRVASVSVSTNIAGRVNHLYVHENQRVKAGQLLFTLDSQPAQVAIEQANAQLADARQRIQADQASYRQQLVQIRTAEQTARFRETERARDYGLMKAGAVSREEYEQSAHEAQVARQQIASARQQLAVIAARLGGSSGQAGGSHPEVRTAAAEIVRARLNESYTTIRAPQDGVVTKVENLQVGDYVNAATPVFNLVLDDAWVEAAFKENQLTNMRVGQTATIKIDAFAGQPLPARVVSIAPGTDQTFSALPAENASGNWVKVVQRVPVRLHFTRKPNVPLIGGLSANVKVDTGHSRTLFGGR
ncbi:MAG TPA: HlyD family secretion protein [Caulobacteraceae bacterium]|jgi:membrane fusion protein (multidrug efflux system)